MSQPHDFALACIREPSMPMCPTITDLEAFVEEGCARTDVRLHIAECHQCAEQIREIENNNAFLVEVARHASSVGGSSAGNGAPSLAEGDEAAATHPPFAAEPMESIPGYDIQRVIGRGGQAVVYEAWQHSTQRRVALKVMLYGAGGGVVRAARFAREVRLVAQLKHPGIVTIFDSGTTTDGRPFFAMEFIQGNQIHTWVSRRAAGDLPPVRETLELFMKVCDAVRYAQQHGVIHRDLKPSNILVDEEGEPHVLDFGLAKEDSGAVTLDVTLSGQFLGTLAYAAPEQVRGNAQLANTRTDVYALGAILYELLTGQSPLPLTGSFSEVVRAITSRDPEKPSAVREEIDGEVETILLKALSKDADRRYDGAGALLDDIRRYLDGEAIAAKRDSTWYMVRKSLRRHRVAAAVASIFIVLGVVYGVTMSLLYGVATLRERETQRLARELSDAVAIGEIERGRQLALSGQAVQAHDVIWRTFHQRSAAEVPARSSQDPVERQAYWALRQLYDAHPVESRWTKPEGLGGIQAMHADGAALTTLIAADDGLVVTWHAIDGTERRPSRLLPLAVVPHDQTILAEISLDGSRAACIVGDRLHAWDLASGDEVCAITLPSSPTEVFRFAGSDFIARVPRGHTAIEIWSLTQGAMARTLRGASSPVTHLAASSDGRVIVAAAAEPESSAALWTWRGDNDTPAAWAPLNLFPLSSRMARLSDLALSPQGDRLATVFGSALDIWNAEGLKHLERLGGASWSISCAYSVDGTRLAAWGSDRRIHVWDVQHRHTQQVMPLGPGGSQISREREQRRPVGVYRAHQHVPTFIAFASRGASMFSTDESGTILAWNLKAHVDQQRVVHENLSAHSAAFTPDQRHVFVGGSLAHHVAEFPASGALSLWSLDEGGTVNWSAHQGLISSVAFARDWAFTASHDGTILRWTISREDSPASTPFHSLADSPAPQAINSLSLSPDERLIAAACDDGAAYIWNTSDGRLAHRFQHAPHHHDRFVRPLSSVAFSPDGRTLASAGTDAAVRLWDLKSNTSRSLTGHTGPVRIVAWHPSGSELASGGDDWTVRIWDAEHATQKHELSPLSHRVFALAYSPDGLLLASGTADGAVTLWDAVTGVQLLSLDAGEGMVFCIEFSHDSRRLLACTNTGLVQIWDLPRLDERIRGNSSRARR